MMKTSNPFLSFIVSSNRNRSALVRELLCNSDASLRSAHVNACVFFNQLSAKRFPIRSAKFT